MATHWDYPPPLQALQAPPPRFCKQPLSPTNRRKWEEIPAEDLFLDVSNSRPSTSGQKTLGFNARMASRSVGSWGWCRNSSAIAPIDQATLTSGALLAGFQRLEGQTFAAESPQLEPLAPASLKNYVMTQLNQMYAYMEQAMSRERARHSSDVNLMLRKVDKDLKETFRAVRETFVSLTEQVQNLLEEVESGKKMMRDVQTKFEAANRAALVRAQYVEELEAVVDGQVPNISVALRKLTEDQIAAKQALEQAKREAEASEQAALEEKGVLENTIRTLEERLNQADKHAGEMKGAVEVPIMQEMAATWTRRLESKSDDASLPLQVDIVGSTLAKCDATRAVMRTKCVRPPRTRSSAAALSPKGKCLRRREELEELERAKTRAREAEQRVAKQQQLILQATPSLRLLRDIFSELRVNWRLPMGLQADENGSTAKDQKQSAKAPDILDRIVQFFLGSFHNLGKFSEILDRLCEESSRPVAQHIPNTMDESSFKQDVPDMTVKPSADPEDEDDEDEAFPFGDNMGEEDFLAPLIPSPKRRSWGSGPNLPHLVEEAAFTKRSFSPR